MSKFKDLKKIFINHPTDDKENDYQADCDFSNYSLEELKAEGEELWEQSRQEDPDGYRRFNDWLNGKSLDDLIKLYSEVVASDFDVSACC
jgi:hypothetical protein